MLRLSVVAASCSLRSTTPDIECGTNTIFCHAIPSLPASLGEQGREGSAPPPCPHPAPLRTCRPEPCPRPLFSRTCRPERSTHLGHPESVSSAMPIQAGGPDARRCFARWGWSEFSLMVCSSHSTPNSMFTASRGQSAGGHSLTCRYNVAYCSPAASHPIWPARTTVSVP